MTNEAMREAFEAWIQSRYPEYPLDVELGNCGRPDSYTWTVVHQMWQAWQASRAQPIVLPQDKDIYGMDSAVILDKCADAITAQGYVIKENE